MQKLRVCVFLLAVATTVVYWWRFDRPAKVAPPINAAAAAAVVPPAQVTQGSKTVPLIGVGGPEAPRTSDGTPVSRGTSGQAGAPRSVAAPRPTGGASARTASAPSSGSGSGSVVIRHGTAADVDTPNTARPGRPNADAALVNERGGIAGSAIDGSGAALEGVQVEVRGGPLGAATRTTTTDARGNYRLTGLPDGTYTVTFSTPSHRSVRRIDVNVSAARVTENIQVTLSR